MKCKIGMFLVLFVLTVLCVPQSWAERAEEDIYYTRANMWYEMPERILSTNYHKGAILPAGTKVIVLAKGKRRIQFASVESDVVFTLQHVKRHSKLLLSEVFDRYFSRFNILDSSEYMQLSAREKQYISEGAIEIGMSKTAVLIAYGYPPSHKTKSIASDLWYYWENRAQYRSFQFKDDVLIDIGARRV